MSVAAPAAHPAVAEAGARVVAARGDLHDPAKVHGHRLRARPSAAVAELTVLVGAPAAHRLVVAERAAVARAERQVPHIGEAVDDDRRAADLLVAGLRISELTGAVRPPAAHDSVLTDRAAVKAPERELADRGDGLARLRDEALADLAVAELTDVVVTPERDHPVAAQRRRVPAAREEPRDAREVLHRRRGQVKLLARVAAAELAVRVAAPAHDATVGEQGAAKVPADGQRRGPADARDRDQRGRHRGVLAAIQAAHRAVAHDHADLRSAGRDEPDLRRVRGHRLGRRPGHRLRRRGRCRVRCRLRGDRRRSRRPRRSRRLGGAARRQEREDACARARGPGHTRRVAIRRGARHAPRSRARGYVARRGSAWS